MGDYVGTIVFDLYMTNIDIYIYMIYVGTMFFRGHLGGAFDYAIFPFFWGQTATRNPATPNEFLSNSVVWFKRWQGVLFCFCRLSQMFFSCWFFLWWFDNGQIIYACTRRSEWSVYKRKLICDSPKRVSNSGWKTCGFTGLTMHKDAQIKDS